MVSLPLPETQKYSKIFSELSCSQTKEESGQQSPEQRQCTLLFKNEKREKKRRGREAGKKAGKEGGERGRKEGKKEQKEGEREKEEKKRERSVN